MTRAVTMLLMLAALAAGPAAPASAENLVTAISADRVSIESNFTGAEIVVFGTIERDAKTVSRRHGHDIVIVVRGPEDEITVRRKDRVAGVWANINSRTYERVPGYLAILSNRNVADIADRLVLNRYRIGLDDLGPTDIEEAPDSPAFREAVVRLMQDRTLYQDEPGAVKFLSPTLFMSQVRLPATTPVGTYKTEVYLFGDGALLDTQSVEIFVHKSGVEQLVTELASDRPLFYGLLTVFLAIFSGWFASVMFRRE